MTASTTGAGTRRDRETRSSDRMPTPARDACWHPTSSVFGRFLSHAVAAARCRLASPPMALAAAPRRSPWCLHSDSGCCRPSSVTTAGMASATRSGHANAETRIPRSRPNPSVARMGGGGQPERRCAEKGRQNMLNRRLYRGCCFWCSSVIPGLEHNCSGKTGNPDHPAGRTSPGSCGVQDPVQARIPTVGSSALGW